MAWATQSSTGIITYIGQLARSQTGLACGCVCPGCGGQVEAVNAGRPKEHFEREGTLRPFFRHATGRQQGKCLARAASAAALRLLLEQDQIDLPAPRGIARLTGISGNTYTGVADGALVTVNRHEWLDTTTARLVTHDGRVIHIRLRGHATAQNHGQPDAVISIEVDDPEVATWSPAEVLRLASLRANEWCHWECHWDDQRLQEEALRAAKQSASEALDIEPADFELPHGLTPMQRSESVLHWHTKNILAEAGELRVPAHVVNAERVMPDGTVRRKRHLLSEATWWLSDVRLEQPLEGLVPDVMCMARDHDGTLVADRLLIEVAVTHRVSGAKAARILAGGYSCLELDCEHLGESGRITATRLRHLIVRDVRCKRWIHHPATGALNARLTRDLQREYEAIRSAEQEHERTLERFSHLDDSLALQEYMGLLVARRAGRPLLDSAGAEWDADDMARMLDERGYPRISDELIAGDEGILLTLHDIRDDGLGVRVPGRSHRHLFRVMESGPALMRWASLVLTALKQYQVFIPSKDSARVGQIRDTVASSIQELKATYVRPTIWDGALAKLFPELADHIASGLCTEQRIGTKVREKYARDEAERASRIAAARRQEAEAHALEEAARRQNALEQVSRRVRWAPEGGIPADLQAALRLAVGNGHHTERSKRSDWIRTAWTARTRGQSLRDWLEEQGVGSAEDVDIMLRALNSAYLIEQLMGKT